MELPVTEFAKNRDSDIHTCVTGEIIRLFKRK